MALMQYMKSLGSKRFNIKAYSRDYYNDVSKRSLVYYYLSKLIKKNLIYSPGTASHKLTEFGNNYLEVSNRDVKTQRSECREKDVNLRTHYIKYKLLISDKSNFNEERLKELGPNGTHKIKWNNDFIYYAYFDDITIIVNPNCVLIQIHDIMVKDTEEAQFETLSKAIEYSNKIRKIGLISSSMELDKPHYERVDSLLASFLKKIDDRYYIELEGGGKLWIDCSGGTNNDETDTEKIRNNVDDFMKKIMKGDIDFTDLKEMREILGLLTTFKVMEMKESLKPKSELLEPPDYFG